MGTYYECNICGKEEKGMWPCNCHYKLLQKEMLRLFVGSQVLDLFSDESMYTNFIYYKLIKNEETPYFVVYEVHKDGIHPVSLTEIDEESYEENKKICRNQLSQAESNNALF